MNNSNIFESHCVNINDRRHSDFTGIDDVLSFDDMSITMHSSMGELILEGEQLKIDSFSSDNGLLSVSGKITALYYSDNDSKKNGNKRSFK